MNSLIPKSLSEIFEYANTFEELGPLAKGYEMKYIINDNKHYIEHKHLI